jgi:hypothetical protein
MVLVLVNICTMEKESNYSRCMQSAALVKSDDETA